MIEATNQRLKEKGYRVRLIRKGNRLYGKATLPLKPGKLPRVDGKAVEQTEFPLGLNYTVAGLVEAESLLEQIGKEIRTKSFKWENHPYLLASSTQLELFAKSAIVKGKTLRQYIEEYKEFLLQCDSSPKRKRSYNQNIGVFLKRLPLDELPNNEAFQKGINSNPTILTKKKALQVYEAFGKWIGINLTLKIPKTKHKEQEKDLPDLDFIFEVFDGIQESGNRLYLWMLAMQLAYGLRVSETFLILNLTKPYRLKDGTIVHPFTTHALSIAISCCSKTGFRVVPFPIVHGIIERYNLTDIPDEVKDSTGDWEASKRYAKRCASYASTKGIATHSLRHYVVAECYRKGYDPQHSCRWLGHSLQIHTTTYRKWLGDKEVLEHGLKAFVQNQSGVSEVDGLKARVKALERENQELREKLIELGVRE